MQSNTEQPEKTQGSGYPFLTAGVLTSVTASICCIGPFALLATGLSGAWMSRVMVVERFQPALIALTLILFTVASWKLFYRAGTSTGNCKTQSAGKNWKHALIFYSTACLALVFLTSEYWIVFLAE